MQLRMKRREEEVDFSSDDDDDVELGSDEEDEDMDSDQALQEAFAAGKLKPGLVVVNKKSDGKSGPEKPVVINDVPMLKLQLDKIKLPKKFGWIERLDIVNDVAPLAPEIAIQLDEHKGKRSREISMINRQRKTKSKVSQPSLKSIEEDPVHNDFVREMGFYRQGQEAVMKCLPRLKEMRVPTKRPDDYFAEMAKSDSHMQKVAQVLLKKQTATERAEKVRKLREQKKFSKQTQIQVMQERQKAKKEMIESVKKYRKGQQGGNLDFLEDKKTNNNKREARGKGRGGDEKTRINYKRQNKNDKYGYGGKKKGSKWNTRDSLDTFEDGKGGKSRGGGGGGKGFKGKGGRQPQMGRGGGKPMTGGRGGKGPSGGGGAKRPGKTSRQKMKGRK